MSVPASLAGAVIKVREFSRPMVQLLNSTVRSHDRSDDCHYHSTYSRFFSIEFFIGFPYNFGGDNVCAERFDMLVNKPIKIRIIGYFNLMTYLFIKLFVTELFEVTFISLIGI